MKQLLYIFSFSAGLSAAVAGEPAIVSAYLGGVNVPPIFLSNVTGCPQNFGDDGMPLVMSVQIKASTLDPEAFRVISRAGVVSTPNCATLRPAEEANELHTILLAGPIADRNDLPDRVEIIGTVEDIDGNVLTGLVSGTVTIGDQSGPSVVYAYLFNKSGGPDGASPRAIQLVWQGGVTGPNGAVLDTDQLNALHVIDCNGIAHTPLAFDDLGDGDNYVELYIPDGVVADRIEVDAGFFFDPMNVSNPATAVQVTSLLAAADSTQIEYDTPAAGHNRIHFLGTPGIPYRVFFTTDLMHWQCIGSISADQTTGAFHLDHDRNSAQKGFYRSTP